ncbi:hypothetical protein V6N11_033394 [Hibiscus sabdariffa]|uniref:Uncharacterized protein n=1 Tax=Hibiscus sabdariffa TaxID=183260 RepID=A0ABR2PXX4_9ROSI
MVMDGASDRVVCDRGGVCSEGDTYFALSGIRSREGLDIVHPSVFVAERDSLGVKVLAERGLFESLHRNRCDMVLQELKLESVFS